MAFDAVRVFEERAAARLTTMKTEDLTPGEVVIRVEWSGINYKDALAVTGRGKILRRVPLNPGIDLAGQVEHSEDPRLAPGTSVIVSGMGLGETQDGGFAERARVPGEWVTRLPEGLTARDAMALGSAGVTALVAIDRLRACGVAPEHGPVVVTGASGGVGSLAVWLLGQAGYTTIAVSGRPAHHEYLRGLGASEALTPEALDLGTRPLERARFAGVLDNVGGELLAGLLRHVQPDGAVVSIGHAGGSDLHTTVYPFILRGVSVLGISAAGLPAAVRESAWSALGRSRTPDLIDRLVDRTVSLRAVPAASEDLIERRVRGRVLVAVQAH